MNYQFLIESYSFGTALSKQEIELFILELETHIMNIQISKEFVSYKPSSSKICKRLNLRKGTLWLMFFAEIIDVHKTSKKIKQKV